MFNKKLKKRIKALEIDLGYSYDGEYYANLEDGVLPYYERKFKAIIDYLDIENDYKGHGFLKFKKRAEKK